MNLINPFYLSSNNELSYRKNYSKLWHFLRIEYIRRNINVIINLHLNIILFQNFLELNFRYHKRCIYGMDWWKDRFKPEDFFLFFFHLCTYMLCCSMIFQQSEQKSQDFHYFLNKVMTLPSSSSRIRWNVQWYGKF